MRTVDRIQLLREIDRMARDHYADPHHMNTHGTRVAPCGRSYLQGAAYGAMKAIEALKGEADDTGDTDD